MRIDQLFQPQREYQPPVVELITVVVERGFADSGDYDDAGYGDKDAAGDDFGHDKWIDYGEL